MKQFEKKFKILELLTTKQYSKIVMKVPTLFWLRMKRIYYLVAINYIRYPEVVNMIFGFGLDILDEIVFNLKVTRYFQMLRIVERVKSLLHDMVVCGILYQPVMRLYDYMSIKSELEIKRNMSFKEIADFFMWMEKEHCFIYPDKLFIDVNLFNTYLNQYEQSKIKSKSYPIGEPNQ